MNVEIVRGDGDRPGQEVVNPLLTTLAVCTARGRRECDYYGPPRIIEQCQCPAQDFYRTGQLATVTESSERWVGQTVYWSLTLSLEDELGVFSCDVGLHLERVRK